ncbi:Thioredoxin [Orpheovirus IHUMI-LCC2]|uniref:Thioredoxin n=1 Tax=Orpheovirus IHUMI-LCC2 TaxID=2023057 RepID=A0A2I2L415_9VIRU|nr:Thioredoxin [Orpheovirus IHUMI-LCC2]SNW62251.1 Thioredoxin [Orpheovirus IHUMI-LCC2]
MGQLKMSVKEIKEKKELDSAIISNEGLVVVDFSATWCGPCKRIYPDYVKIAEEHNSSALCYKVNIDEVDEVAESYGVTAMPTFKFYKGGKLVEEFKGANVEKLKETMKKWI